MFCQKKSIEEREELGWDWDPEVMSIKVRGIAQNTAC